MTSGARPCRRARRPTSTPARAVVPAGGTAGGDGGSSNTPAAAPTARLHGLRDVRCIEDERPALLPRHCTWTIVQNRPAAMAVRAFSGLEGERSGLLWATPYLAATYPAVRPMARSPEISVGLDSGLVLRRRSRPGRRCRNRSRNAPSATSSRPRRRCSRCRRPPRRPGCTAWVPLFYGLHTGTALAHELGVGRHLHRQRSSAEGDQHGPGWPGRAWPAEDDLAHRPRSGAANLLEGCDDGDGTCRSAADSRAACRSARCPDRR